MFIIFDTETTGLPRDYFAPYSSSDNWPRLVQLAWQIHDNSGNLIEAKNYIIKPEGFEIPYETIKVHGISTERAVKFGHNLMEVLQEFNQKLEIYKFIVGHNISFDEKIIGAEMYRKEVSTEFLEKINQIDTKNSSTEYCAIPGKGKGFKWPSLSELHLKLFNENFDEAHNAAADVEATARCFLELVRIGVIEKKALMWSNEDLDNFRNKNRNRIEAIGLETKAYDDSELISESPDEKNDNFSNNTTDIDFTHLHVHTQFSILDGLTNIKKLAAKAKKDGMKAVAITDHGNMYGVKEFHQTLSNEGLKPIIGSEVYMAYRTHLDKERQDSSSYHLVLLAKNEIGYRNLIKLSSIGFIDGFYYKPRIDKDLLKEYSEGIIALSACLGGEIPQKIMKSSVEAAENVALEYKAIFGEDFYIELQRHKTNIPDMNTEVYKDQVFVNEKLIEIAKKHNIKYVATNDVHFLNQDDYLAHDRLICLNTGKDIDDVKRIKYTGQEWFKTRDEMAEIFADIPESLLTTQEITDKIETYELDKKAIMPDFKMPEPFENYNEYLRHISYEGAKERWGVELSEEITSRLDFELETIEKMLKKGYEEILIITISSMLSGTYSGAVMAANMIDHDHIHVFDSRSASFPEARMALDAAGMAAQGKSIEEIMEHLEFIRDHHGLYFSVDTLKYLVKNGRLSGASGFVGALLKIKPLLMMTKDGRVESIEKIRTSSKSLNRVVEKFLEEIEGKDVEPFIIHAEANDRVADVKKELKKRKPELVVPEVYPLTPVVGAHTGPGVVALGYIEKK